MPRFITKRIHAYLDYPVALALIVLPFLLNLGQSSAMAIWLSVATGVAAFLLTLLTDHHLGLVRVLSYKLHLVVDMLVGVAFVVAPFVLKFENIDATYYWFLGVAVLVVVSLHKPEST